MIYLIFGKDTFRAKKRLREIVERYKSIHKSGLNLKIFDLKEKSFEEFKSEFKNSPMFEEKKLFILKNPTSNFSFKEKFLKEIDFFTRSKDLIFFFEEGEIKRDNFFEAVEKYGKVIEFRMLDNLRLKDWIKKEFQKYGAKLERGVVEKMIEILGNDLWQIENEIKKLVAFKKGKIISKKDVEELVFPNFQINVFQVIDAILSKNKKRALILLKESFERKKESFEILTLIKTHLRNLIKIKDLMEREPIYKIKEKINLHPFFFEKLKNLAQKFDLAKLKKLYQKVFELDFSIKTGKIDPETALTLFCFQI